MLFRPPPKRFGKHSTVTSTTDSIISFPDLMASSIASLPVVARSMSLSCRSALRQKSPIAPFLYPLQQQQVRGAKNNPQARNKKDKPKKKDKGAREFKQKDLKDITQFSLCDAMRLAIFTFMVMSSRGGHGANTRTQSGTSGRSKLVATVKLRNMKFTSD